MASLASASSADAVDGPAGRHTISASAAASAARATAESRSRFLSFVFSMARPLSLLTV